MFVCRASGEFGLSPEGRRATVNNDDEMVRKGHGRSIDSCQARKKVSKVHFDGACDGEGHNVYTLDCGCRPGHHHFDIDSRGDGSEVGGTYRDAPYPDLLPMHVCNGGILNLQSHFFWYWPPDQSLSTTIDCSRDGDGDTAETVVDGTMAQTVSR